MSYNIDFNDAIEEEEDDLLSEEESADNNTPEIRERIKIDKNQEPLRIDKFLMNRIEGATRNKLQQAIEEGFVLVNNQTVKPNHKIKAFDEIIVFETRKPEYSEIVPENIAIDIVFEDEHIMVVNKPAGMVVHPGCGNYRGTLANALAWYLNPNEDKENTELPRMGLVHRIDKDTSGLLLIAKTEPAMKHLAAQFKAHSTHRRYVALAWGDFDKDEGTIEGHIGRNLRYKQIMDVFPDGSYGKHATTHYTVLERFRYVTLLQFRLETGRTHQIRVHSKYIGHPLFGDETYGGNTIVKGTVYAKYKQFVDNCLKILPRQALHAKELGFIHPHTQEQMFFDSELPADMVEVIERWRNYTNEAYQAK